MAKITGTQGPSNSVELVRVPGTEPAPVPAKARKAALRKRPDEELIAPGAAFTDGANLPDQSVATDELPPQSLEEEVPGEAEEVAEDGGSAEDAYSSVEADAWSVDWTPATGSEDNILLAQAGGGGNDDSKGGALFDDDPSIGLFAGIGALLLLGGGGGGGGGGAGGAASFADANEELGATTPDTVVAPVPGTAHNFYIGSAAGLGVNEGFSRDELPASLAQLEPIYDFRYSNATSGTGTIDHTGLQVNMAASDPTGIFVSVSALADASTESHLIWLGNVGVAGSALSYSADATVNVHAIAQAGGDAEVGISNFNISVAGTGAVTASASLYASATGADSMAGAFIGNAMQVNATAESAYARVDRVRAYAQGTDAVASAAIGGNLSVSAVGSASASASAGTIYASAMSGNAAAQVQIGGGVDVYAAAASGNAYAFVDEVYADATTSSYAHVAIGGDVSATAIGGNVASASVNDIWASADSDSTAEVDIAGGVNVYAYASHGSAYAYLGTVSASASVSSEARVDIGGPLSVAALGDGFARADMDGIWAGAEGATTSSDSILGAGSTAEVDIAGGVGVYAYAASGTAYASMGSITAYASNSSEARVDIGGDVLAFALGQDFASASVDGIWALAEGAATDSGEAIPGGGSTAEIDIAGGVYAFAIAESGAAYASVGSISASASISSYAHVDIGGPVAALAVGPDFASVQMGSISASADGAQTYSGAAVPGGGSTAEVDIAGGVYVYAYAASGNAYANMDSISADASTSSVARVDIGGDVLVAAVGQGLAYADMDSISADADGGENAYGDDLLGSGSRAEIDIAGGVYVYAYAATGAASADMGSISASASISSYAHVDIGGDVSVKAFGQDFASAQMGSISASADGAQTYSGAAISGGGSTAEVNIAGGVYVYASAASGAAYASMGSVYAAASTSSVARVNIGGDVSVGAFGQDRAAASVGAISASAEGAQTYSGAAVPGGGSTAEVNIAGGVEVYAYAASGAAYVYMGDIAASASISSYAHVEIGGDVSVRAFGQAFASASMDSISAYAVGGRTESGDALLGAGSTAEVNIAGGVYVYAYAATGAAFASISTISASASTNSIARVDIGGDVSVRAFGQDLASAEMGSISASADGAQTYSGAAMPGGGSTAEVNIAGGVEVYAYAASGAAYANMDSISASASTSSLARVDIGGDVSVRAIGPVLAVADMSSISASANGAQTYSGAADPGGGSTAEVNIAGGVEVYAYAASGKAYAALNDISASASTSSYAHVDIGGDVSVKAFGQYFALADMGGISASADGAQTYSGEAIPGGGSTAEVDIAGGVTVHATAEGGSAYVYAYVVNAWDYGYQATGEAYASMGSISASASSSSVARVDIGGDVSVKAIGPAVASAQMGSIGASADGAQTYSGADVVGAGSTAEVNIAGGLSVYAGAENGTAYASADEIYADASTNSFARVEIGEGVSVEAFGQDFASAYLGGINADAAGAQTYYGSAASGGTSTAEVDIAYDVNVNAYAASGTAYASVGSIAASASTSSYANVDIGGDVYVTAMGSNLARAYLQEIGADASYSASAEVSIGGNVNVYAAATSGDAVAHVGWVHVHADGGGDGAVGIASYLSVSAMAGDDAYAYVQGIHADAHQSAYASVSIGGDVLVSAEGSDYAVAFIGEGISASAGYASDARVDIGGVAVYAAASTYSGDAIANAASAYIGQIGAYAYNSGANATVSISGDVSVQAAGVESARAGIGSVTQSGATGISATALDGASANVRIGDDLRVSASATGSYSVEATAFVGALQAYAYGSGEAANASVSVSDDVTIYATAGAFAGAYIGVIGAWAHYGDDAVDVAQADVYVGGGVGVYGYATQDTVSASVRTASAFVGGIFAEAGEYASASVAIGNDLAVLAIAEGSAAAQSYSTTSAAATAQMSVYALAFVGDVDAYAFGDSGQATVSIGGDLSVRAEARATASAEATSAYSADARATATSDARAYVGDIHAHAGGSDSSARVLIGGDLRVHASATYGSAYAEASDAVIAYATAIAGHDAQAHAGSIAAYAADDTAQATVSVTYSVEVRAYASDAQAQAYASGNVAAAYASATNDAEAYVDEIGAAADDTNAYARVLIGEDVLVRAYAASASANAQASYASVYASATAIATNDADAWVGRIAAYADDDTAQATVSIGRDLRVQAEATNADAQARALGDDATYAYAYASATNHAEAYVGEIGAYAGETNAYARVLIADDVSVIANASYASADAQAADASYATATAIAQNGAHAWVESVAAFAGSDNARATVSIGDDLEVRANAEQAIARADASYASTASAYASATNHATAYVGGIEAYANDTNAYARVLIGGDVVVHANATYASAEADASRASYASATAVATGEANAWIGGIGAVADHTLAQATVSIGGNVDVRATAHAYASASASSASYASANASATSLAQAYVEEIGAYANGADAYARVLIGADPVYGGDVNVIARASASADAYAVGYQDDSDSDNTYATATAFIGTMGAVASGANAFASLSVDGDVTVGAVGEDRAVAYVQYVSASANSGSLSYDAVAQAAMDSLNVYATAENGVAYAYVDSIVAFASDNAQASVTIGAPGSTYDAVSVRANGTYGASAYVPIHAYATTANATAQIVINGNVRVAASADAYGVDAYAQLLVAAGVTYRSDGFHTGDGRVEINGNIYLSASLDNTGSTVGAAHAYGQLIALGSGSVYVAGSVNISVDESGDAWLDIYAASENGVDIGDLNVELGAGANADVYVQRSMSTSMLPSDFFLAHGSSNANIGIGDVNVDVAFNAAANFFIGEGSSGSSNADGIDWDLNRTADLNGAGDVYMQLFDQIFGTIDASDLSGAGNHLSLEYDLGDHDFLTVGTGANQAHVTTVVGFSESGTNITFNGTNAATSNFISLGVVTATAAAFTAQLVGALDATYAYVFAVYNGTGDINGDLQSDLGNGFLAYDKDGDGITAVLMLPGVTTMLPSDISPP